MFVVERIVGEIAVNSHVRYDRRSSSQGWDEQVPQSCLQASEDS